MSNTHNSYGKNSIWTTLDSSFLWLALYFVLNLALTLYNKAILDLFEFPFPWTLTAIHTLCGAIGSYVFYLLGIFSPAKLGERESMVMLMFSVLYTINIAISNVSLENSHFVCKLAYLTLILLPVPSSGTGHDPRLHCFLVHRLLAKNFHWYDIPFVTTGMWTWSFLVWRSRRSEITTTQQWVGITFSYCFFLTVLGTILAAIKTIVTNRVQVGRLKLHPLDLLLRMSPLAFVQTIIYAYVTGELEEVRAFARTDFNYSLGFALLANGIIAFFLNVVSFTANKKTSALTMTVAANVKQVLSIVLAVIIFHLNITIMNAAGIMLTLIGGVCFGKGSEWIYTTSDRSVFDSH
ncbi:triose-phosphate transporter family-domain-containing protein, partial [Jimgerdemannia flammicorona]